MHVVVVEIPVEAGLAFVLQVGEEPLLDGLQHVEAHEEITALKIPTIGGLLESFSHLPVECPFVGQLLVSQPSVEVVVDVAHA